MDELIAKISEKTGLRPEQAKAAAEAVLEFLKSRLPAPLAANLESIVSGGTGAAEDGGGILGGAAAKFGSMFGKDN